MAANTERLKLGFSVDNVEIPTVLKPLLDDVVECYKHHHSDLLSVYAIGSIAIGEWEPGVSDADIVGVTVDQPVTDAESGRRSDLVTLGDEWPLITFIDNSAFSLRALHSPAYDPIAIGRARLIAISGLCLWGDTLDFRAYIPTVETMAYERTARAEALMRKYRAGDLIEPFRRDESLLIRSCAKAAIRVLSSITILRGALFYTSPRKTVAIVEQYVPEATQLSLRALSIVEGGVRTTTPEAMSLTDQAVELFYRLYPQSQD